MVHSLSKYQNFFIFLHSGFDTDQYHDEVLQEDYVNDRHFVFEKPIKISQIYQFKCLIDKWRMILHTQCYRYIGIGN